MSILTRLATTAVALAIIIQLRLSSLGIAPISKPLPPLLPWPANPQILTGKLQKIGEGDLLGPECLVLKNGYMFMSLGDGRIVRAWHVKEGNGENLQWETLVRTGDNSASANCGKGGPTDSTKTEETCGRPLGMTIVNSSAVIDDGEEEDVLLVADAYRGLLLIRDIYSKGSAKLLTLATRAKTDDDGKSFQLLNGLIAAPDGAIYFTETSQDFHRRRIFHAAFDGRAAGRLLKFTKQNDVTVAAEELYMPNGLSVSHDEQYLLIVSGVQILKYSLKKRAMESKSFTSMPGTGDNIVTRQHLPNGTPSKCYWAALGSKFAEPFSLLKAVSEKPYLKSILIALVPYKTIVEAIPKLSALAVYGEDGTLLDIYQDGDASAPWLSEGTVFGDYVYLGSWYNDFLARVKVEELAVTSKSTKLMMV